jgi:glutamate synthase domain-containing protein 2
MAIMAAIVSSIATVVSIMAAMVSITATLASIVATGAHAAGAAVGGRAASMIGPARQPGASAAPAGPTGGHMPTVRQLFFGFVWLCLVFALVCAVVWPAGLWALVVAAPVVALGLVDAFQKRQTIRRNFPVLGHGRYLMEMIRPEIQQYFIESSLDAFPLTRQHREVAYARSKNQLETIPFGSHHNMYAPGYEFAEHSIAPAKKLDSPPRILIGAGQCAKPYSASLLNISAMSYGSLSPNAIEALNRGAKLGNFAHNTGEGGISRYHLEPGGDLVWQIGTGYFGCRNKDGTFNAEMFAERARHDAVKMVELKISQGAKPGHGGVLPGVKVTQEIADIRGLEPGKTVISPAGHSAFGSPMELLAFLTRMRELSGGKPVGMKLCIGRADEFFAICKAMVASGMHPDSITVDGGEGGTGAAPLEFSDSLGMPAHDAWIFVHNALVGAGLRDKIRVIASGKIMTGFHMLRALALGADACNSARGMMLALGCIQALRCNTNKCPTGVATTDPRLARGLDATDKGVRVASFHHRTVDGFLELLAALGLSDPADLRPAHINRRVGDTKIANYSDLYEWARPRVLLTVDGQPADEVDIRTPGRAAAWARADKDHWVHPASPRPSNIDPKAGQDSAPKE